MSNIGITTACARHLDSKISTHNINKLIRTPEARVIERACEVLKLDVGDSIFLG